MKPAARNEDGFTMVEAIVVIAITGIIAGMVAVFIRSPVEGYFDLARRTELTDTADTAVRRISRDVRTALPNSIRMPSSRCFEYLSTSTGGRYRAETPGDILNLDGADTGFEVLGIMNPVPAVNDQVVVYNLGIPGADAYAGDNRAAVASASASSIVLAAPFAATTLASPSNRFYVVPAAEQAVFYVCNNPGLDGAGNGTGTLLRLSAYGINAAPPAACPAVPPGTPVLAQNISACNFVYTAGITQRTGLVSLDLSLTRENETVRLLHDVHIDNAP